MSVTIAKHGHDISLVVADGLGDAVEEGVQILDVGKPKSRLSRMKNTTQSILAKALSTNADIFHFHDPELLMIAKSLKSTGAKVFFDAHEDMRCP